MRKTTEYAGVPSHAHGIAVDPGEIGSIPADTAHQVERLLAEPAGIVRRGDVVLLKLVDYTAEYAASVSAILEPIQEKFGVVFVLLDPDGLEVVDVTRGADEAGADG